MECMFLHPRPSASLCLHLSSAAMVSLHAMCICTLMDNEIQKLLMNSDSDESDSEEAAQLNDLLSEHSEEEPLQPKSLSKKRNKFLLEEERIPSLGSMLSTHLEESAMASQWQPVSSRFLKACLYC